MDIGFIFIWIILFTWRKDIRKEMLIMSTLWGFVGLIAGKIYIKDWWCPLTIMGIIPSIEDFIFGFVIGGIASIIYQALFLKKMKRINKQYKTRNLNIISLLSLLGIIFIGTVYILKVNTLIASILAWGVPLIIIYIRRKDLIKNSLISGLIITIIAVFIYQLTEIITPGWINLFWSFEFFGNLTILKIPLEEYIWFFLAGAFIGPLYEYWQEAKLIKRKR